MSLADGAATAAYVRAGHPAVRAIAPLAEGVWRIEDADGRKVVVKHQLFGRLTQGTAYDLLEVERDVLDFLHRAGCPVPAVLGIDQERTASSCNGSAIAPSTTPFRTEIVRRLYRPYAGCAPLSMRAPNAPTS